MTINFDINDAAGWILSEPLADDIADGKVPATVASFSELHDYVDANDYIVCVSTESGYDFDCLDLEIANAIAARVDVLLHARIHPTWECEDCGWEWPLASAPDGAECDHCGGELVVVVPE